MIVSIIGLGYWGHNILRILESTPNLSIKYICDISKERLTPYLNKYKCTTDYNDILCDKDVDLVFLITPISTHYTLITECISKKKHVFVEKPLCKTTVEMKYIYELADSNGVSVFCDYTFLFSDKIKTLKKYVSQHLDEILYIEMRREAFGPFVKDNIIFDFLPHDVSILQLLFGDAIKINHADRINDHITNIKTVINFSIGNIRGVISLSRLNSTKVRTITVFCKTKIIEYNDISDILSITDYRVDATDFGVTGVISGKKDITNINHSEPLRNSVDHFLQNIGDRFDSNRDVSSYVINAIEQTL
jgi:predicted dehydrogenase